MEPLETISIDDIILVFREFDGIYQKEMVDAAIQRREKIIPRLIAVLEQVIADPDEYIKDQDLYDHIYALMLLGYFKACDAHDTIIRLFSLPDKIPHNLFGEIAADYLPAILLRTCGGSIERIKAMALDLQADDYCRIAALQTLSLAVAEGIAARQEVMAFLGTLFTGDEAKVNSDFWSFAADTLLELYPEESMTVIEKGFEDDLIFEGLVERKSFDQALALGKEKVLAQLEAKLEKMGLNDIHAAMSWWSCFKNDAELVPAATPTDLFASDFYGNASGAAAKKNNPAQKKKKRKQAKVAKRKNRQ